MKPSLFHFNQEMTRVSAEVARAKVLIHQARSIQEVVRAMEVRVRPQFRCLKHLMHGLRQLPREAERRVEQILQTQLAEISALPDPLARRDRLAMYRASHWRHLYGRFPRLARMVHEASSELAPRSVGNSLSGIDAKDAAGGGNFSEMPQVAL